MNEKDEAIRNEEVETNSKTNNNNKKTEKKVMRKTAKNMRNGAKDNVRENMGYRVLAKNVMRSNDTWSTGLNNNDLIVGASCCGKTGGYVVPNIQEATHSMVVADTKCMLYRKFHKHLEKKGFETHLIDFVVPERSEAFNPLDAVGRYTEEIQGEDGEKKTVVKYRQADLKKLAVVLVPKDYHEDAFWPDAARNVLISLMAYVLEVLPEEEQHMGSVTEMFKELVSCTSERNKGVYFFDELEVLDPKSFAVSMYHMYRGNIPAEKCWGSIMQFVSNALDVFTYREYDRVFNHASSFRFEDMGHKKMVVFLNVSDSERSMYPMINLFYTQLIQRLLLEADNQEEGRLEVPVRIILDDFASNVQIEDFDKIVSIIRSREIYVSVILQSVSQLEGMYGSAQASTIINNCDTMLYLGGGDIYTNRFIAERANRLPETVQQLANTKLMIFCRGQEAKVVDKIRPWSTVADDVEP